MTLPTKHLFHFLDILEQENVPYALIGGLAISILVRQRFTKDIDFIILLDDKSHTHRLLDRLKKDPEFELKTVSYVSSNEIPDFIRIIGKDLAVDYLVANTEYMQELIRRSVPHSVGSRVIHIATLEDMLILKLLADRPQDRIDVDWIIHACPSMDWPYLEKWCRVWEIEDRLKKIRSTP